MSSLSSVGNSSVRSCVCSVLQPGEEDAHAVEQWTEQEVVDWLFSMDSTELAQYATLFEYHHINGRSLFLLRAEDLLQMGIHSLGHQKELLEEVEQLRRTNHRLLHFPPLQHQQNKVNILNCTHLVTGGII